MYDTLQPALITCTAQERRLLGIDPTYVVSWEIFSRNSFPYLEVRRPFILGTAAKQWKATIAHRFVELLEQNLPAKLTRLYTQNIDGLHQQCTGLPADKIVPVHGTLSRVACEGCGTPMDGNVFCEQVRTRIKDIYHMDRTAPATSSPILCSTCDRALVKPTTVLFGRSLSPDVFARMEEDLPHVDLLLVAGTSLVVSPVNSIVNKVPSHTKRVVINTKAVGQDLGVDYSGSSSRDLFLQGSCDEVFLELIQHLGWLDQLSLDDLPEASAALVQRARLRQASFESEK
jgi:NAD-dependent SIR2 family protein deacetylase